MDNAQIVRLIIEEAQARPDKDICDNLRQIHAEIGAIILKLSVHLQQIEDMDITEDQKRVFKTYLLDTPVY
jgi:hypothetical protein